MSGASWKKAKSEVKAEPIPEVEEIFVEAKTKLENIGLRIGIYGEAGTGKTRFLFTAPKPIFIIDSELGVEETLEDYKRDNDPSGIYYFKVPAYTRNEKGELVLDVETTLRNIENAVNSILNWMEKNPDKVGTICIDSASDVWDWLGQWLTVRPDVKKTSDGKPQQLEWQHANKRIGDLMVKLLNSYEKGWNIILTGKIKEEYASAGKPIEIRGRWHKDTQHWVSIVLFFFKEYERSDNTTELIKSRKYEHVVLKKTKFKRKVLVEKCRLRGSLEGVIFEDLTWDKLMDEIFG